MTSNINKLLIIPHLKVHNANALSSPFTIGFPAMTAWLGAVHALQRKLNEQEIQVTFIGTGVISHDMDLQTYKGKNDFVHSIIGTGNPLDKTGARSPFIEEARCHLDVSLIIEMNQTSHNESEHLLQIIEHLLHTKIKIAEGHIKSFDTPFCMVNEQGNVAYLHKLQRKLMPGYALIERRELMVAAKENGMDSLDALIDYLAIHYHCELDDQENVTWHRGRKKQNGKSIGWVVPIATGFQAISDIGEAKNQRDEETPHRFAESVVTLGEFKMVHRINRIEDLLWHYKHDGDLYLCQQK